jgi:hypothetical protein
MGLWCKIKGEGDVEEGGGGRRGSRGGQER